MVVFLHEVKIKGHFYMKLNKGALRAGSVRLMLVKICLHYLLCGSEEYATFRRRFSHRLWVQKNRPT